MAYYQDGKRKRTLLADLGLARTEAETIATRLGNSDADVLTLTSADRAAYLRAREALAPLGVAIETAAVEFAEATRRLQGIPLLRAVDAYLQRNPRNVSPRTVAEVVQELLAAKEHDGLSTEYVRQLRMALGLFSKSFTGPIGDVRGAVLDGWLRGQGWAPRTRNNMRRSVQTLFNFAKARKYLAKDHDEMEAVAVAKDGAAAIEIFTPAELAEVLARASERLVPFLPLGAFAGIRSAEIQRLDWQDVRLEDGIVEIRAGNAKTASRRVVPILPNLHAWLKPHWRESGPVCDLRNLTTAIHGVVGAVNAARAGGQAAGRTGKRKVSGAESEVPEFKWKHNALRHSFISYRVAQIQNVAQVALEAGNSPQIIFKHYRELVRPAEAEKWFGIVPEQG